MESSSDDVLAQLRAGKLMVPAEARAEERPGAHQVYFSERPEHLSALDASAIPFH